MITRFAGKKRTSLVCVNCTYIHCTLHTTGYSLSIFIYYPEASLSIDWIDRNALFSSLIVERET